MCPDESPLDRPKRELLALVVLAAFGCGLALAQGDIPQLIFAAASVVTIIGLVRRSL